MGGARWFPVLLAACLLVALGRDDAMAQRPANGPGAIETGSDFRGSGSCSAIACHGSISPLDSSASRVRRDEHTTWISDDVHSRAFQTLLGDESKRIESNLAGKNGVVRAASEDERCLACHTTPRPKDVLKATSKLNADGVGCESCHGAARRWLGPHTTIGWETKDRQAKAVAGMENTKDLAHRAEVCARCHVGHHTPDGSLVRDVNHDLIAAGHPRLYFEFSASLDNMPPHWDEKDENAGPIEPNGRAPDFAARAWPIGRLATMKVAVELLERRAVKAKAVAAAPWPEFTEYGCFSCHHDLRDEPWRRAARADGVTAGTPRWGSWPRPALDDLIADLIAKPKSDNCIKALDELSKVMASPIPDECAAQEKARAAAKELGSCLDELAPKRLSGGAVQQLLDRLNSGDAWKNVASWDEACQRYLALVPLRQSMVAMDPDRKSTFDALESRLQDLRCKLMFPPGSDSPRELDASQFRLGR
jgi:hypothetical protein